ncbi:glycosyltransferase family 39 protein [Candidatus Saccharibacteria bacterium]|nr:glycosyltransferase family 39 protein [Candidatus Saccharibacteria bacterium]
MAKQTIKNYTLYKLRFWLGYGFLAIATICVLVFAALYVPGGYTPAEQQSALQSASLSFARPESLLIVDLPYHALQKLSISVFGLSSISVKLPSLLLGFAIVAGLILVLRRRFTQTASILASGIIVVSAFFISLATTGTPEIMLVFWPVALLLVASFGVKNRTLQPFAIYAGSVIAALSLLTPFSAYILFALLVASLLHPHTRYLFRKASRSAIMFGGFVIFAMLALIAYASYRDLTFLTQLLYHSSHFSLDILANLKLLGMQLIDVASTTTNQTGLLAPVFGLSTLSLAGLGVYHLLRGRHSALSYLTFTWLLVLLPVVTLNPTSLALLVVPVALLVASGSGFLLNYWYKLFPRNPYARIFALIPVTILFACIIVSGAVRYFYSFHYYAPLANSASNDIELVVSKVDSIPKPSVLVSPSELPFYKLYFDSHNLSNIPLSAQTKDVLRDGGVHTNVIATRSSSIIASDLRPTEVIATSELHMESDRLYIYKKATK